MESIRSSAKDLLWPFRLNFLFRKLNVVCLMKKKGEKIGNLLPREFLERREHFGHGIALLPEPLHSSSEYRLLSVFFRILYRR